MKKVFALLLVMTMLFTGAAVFAEEVASVDSFTVKYS